MAYVNAALKNAGIDVQAINLNQIPLEMDANAILASRIVKEKIYIVLCGGLSPHWHAVKQVFWTAKSIDPNIITIGGGGLFSAEPIVASEVIGVDYAVIGEGESTDVELIQILNDHWDISKMNGIVYKTPDGYRMTPTREEIKDLDSIPFPNYDGFGLEKHLQNQKIDNHPLTLYGKKIDQWI